MLTAFLVHWHLVLRLGAQPTMDLVSAIAHVDAAERAAGDDLSPELLLAVAYIESRYDPTATSRVERGVRRTGRYPSRRPPGALDRHASLFCGVLQAYARTWSRCLELRDLDRGYRAGAAELRQWLRDRRVLGNRVLALAGHACGNYGIATGGTCRGYAARVLRIVRQLGLPQPRVRPPASRPSS